MRSLRTENSYITALVYLQFWQTAKGQKRDECLEFYKLHPLAIKMPLYIIAIREKSTLLWPCRKMRRIVPWDVFMNFAFKLLQSFSTSSHSTSTQISPQEKLLKSAGWEQQILLWLSHAVFISYWSDSVMKFGQHLAPRTAKIICYQKNGSGKNSFTLPKIFPGIYHLHQIGCPYVFVHICTY